MLVWLAGAGFMLLALLRQGRLVRRIVRGARPLGDAGWANEVALDASRCAGAVTVARRPTHFEHDPFARLFPPTSVRVDFLSPVPPPPGPVIERYAGAPWPGGSF